eukprot:TRINITY_DN14395_c0_g1_i1.p1 TRINITY_DN14395_c0_g1~~TRINITY_DN14395_c0_g1_i1.p1  ORF type:complete len:811 (+),score=191.83 TRINITY_DN14395_c0_g1_i1:128-2560(+)
MPRHVRQGTPVAVRRATLLIQRIGKDQRSMNVLPQVSPRGPPSVGRSITDPRPSPRPSLIPSPSWPISQPVASPRVHHSVLSSSGSAPLMISAPLSGSGRDLLSSSLSSSPGREYSLISSGSGRDLSSLSLSARDLASLASSDGFIPAAALAPIPAISVTSRLDPLQAPINAGSLSNSGPHSLSSSGGPMVPLLPPLSPAYSIDGSNLMLSPLGSIASSAFPLTPRPKEPIEYASRRHFSFLRSPPPDLQGVVLFDNAGRTQCLQEVTSLVVDYLHNSSVQVGGFNEVARRAANKVREGNEAVARFINAKSVEEVCLGSSVTQLFQNLSQSFDSVLQPGDEIIVTDCDHEANIGCWLRLAQRTQCVVKEWKINTTTFMLDTAALAELLSPRTRLVCMTHCSNVLGTINAVKAVAQLVHAHTSAVLIVDGSAFAPHRRVDVQDLGVDFYAFSFYKVFGPHIGVLYGKRDYLLSLSGINYFYVAEDCLPYKLQPGSHTYELAYGLLGVLNYFVELGHTYAPDHTALYSESEYINFAFDEITAHEHRLTEKLLAYLTSDPDIVLVGRNDADPSVRVPTVSFLVKGIDPEQIVWYLDQCKFACQQGDFDSRRLIDALGLGHKGERSELSFGKGVIRLSLVHYNTMDELDRLIKIFKDEMFVKRTYKAVEEKDPVDNMLADLFKELGITIKGEIKRLGPGKYLINKKIVNLDIENDDPATPAAALRANAAAGGKGPLESSASASPGRRSTGPLPEPDPKLVQKLQNDGKLIQRNNELLIRIGGGYEKFRVWLAKQGASWGFEVKEKNGIKFGVRR